MPNPPDWRSRAAEREAEARLAEVRAKPVYRTAKPFGSALTRALAPILKEAGPSADTLTARWAEIVGARLAAVTQPIRVAPAKGGGVLHLRAPSAAAPMIQHAQEHILERVNLASGSKVKSIKIIQTTAPPAKKAASAPPPLSDADREALFKELAEVRDPAVRQALTALGVAVLTRQKSRE
jgi:hypothetical protein